MEWPACSHKNTDQLSLFGKKLMNFIVLNLISIRKDFYSFFLYTIVSTGDLIFYLISS